MTELHWFIAICVVYFVMTLVLDWICHRDRWPWTSKRRALRALSPASWRRCDLPFKDIRR